MTQTDNTNTDQKTGYQSYMDDLQVMGDQILAKVKELVQEGNARHIVIKQEGRTIAEFPLTFGVVGALVAPALAVAGTIGALLTQCSIEAVRKDLPTSGAEVPPDSL
jgi:Domain of unknown function (DUF4342)